MNNSRKRKAGKKVLIFISILVYNSGANSVWREYARRKAKFSVFLQRVGVWCEPMKERKCSTFPAADESRKGKPFIAV